MLDDYCVWHILTLNYQYISTNCTNLITGVTIVFNTPKTHETIFRGIHTHILIVLWGTARGAWNPVIALPYLPAEHILLSFEEIADNTTLAAPAVQDLVAYIRETWIQNSMWPPESWSVFNGSVRTNNDTEGWHRRLNTRGRANQHMYMLINNLYSEAKLVPVQVQLVRERKLKRHQRKAFKNMQGRLFDLWDRYTRNEIKTSQLLSACSHLSAPHVD